MTWIRKNTSRRSVYGGTLRLIRTPSDFTSNCLKNKRIPILPKVLMNCWLTQIRLPTFVSDSGNMTWYHKFDERSSVGEDSLDGQEVGHLPERKWYIGYRKWKISINLVSTREVHFHHFISDLPLKTELYFFIHTN